MYSSFQLHLGNSPCHMRKHHQPHHSSPFLSNTVSWWSSHTAVWRCLDCLLMWKQRIAFRRCSCPLKPLFRSFCLCVCVCVNKLIPYQRERAWEWGNRITANRAWGLASQQEGKDKTHTHSQCSCGYARYRGSKTWFVCQCCWLFFCMFVSFLH